MSIVPETPVSRTRPIVIQDCPACKGTGKVVTDVEPFVVLESIQGRVAELQHALGREGEDVGIGLALAAIAEEASLLVRQLACLLPEEHERSSGQPYRPTVPPRT